jgi:nucleotide-binding universal stress UspA family protein
MKRFKNILFVSDNHERGQEAFARAAQLATRNEARLTVVGTVKVSALDALIGHKTVSLGDLQQRLVSERSDQINESIKSLENDKLDVSSKVLLSAGFVEIIQEVLRNEHDLVIKAAESWAGMNTSWFGSSDLHLMRKCPCPVWIVKPTRRRRYERILAAVDTDPVNSDQDQLNHLIMDLATSIAEIEDSELHVVHAWELQGDDWMAARVALSDEEIRAISQEVHDQHQITLDKLLAEYKSEALRMRSHLIEGRPGMVIPEQARRHDVNLIIMGTVARTGLPGFIIGNTAENVLNQVECSVLTVKPQGFDTPVRLAS